MVGQLATKIANVLMLALILWQPILLLAIAVAFASAATWQEVKAHSKSDDPMSWRGCAKCWVVGVYWVVASAVASAVSLPVFLLSGGGAAGHRLVHPAARAVGTSMMRLFVGKVVVVGRENIPDSNAVFVFNHQSQLDIMAAYSLGRQFSWISKDVLGLVPGIGTLMWIAGDVLIARKQKGSIGDMFKKVEEKLADGDADIFIFPQGTRQRSGSLPFKHGAFTMSLNSSKPIVPVTCDIAPGVWGRSIAEVLSPAVTLTVHPAIAANSGTKEELTKRAYDAVYSCLKPGTGSKAHSD